MKKKQKIQSFLTSIYIIICLISSKAQDVEFSQFFNSKNYLNPAFTASSNDISFTSLYRNQWPNIKDAYNSYYVSFDSRVKEKSGFGVFYIGDIAGEGSLRRQTLSFQYSHQSRLAKEIYLSFGINSSYNNISIRWDKLIWGDMLDARKGVIYNTNQASGTNNESYFDSGAGFVLFTKHFYGGMAIDHMNRPKQGLLNIFENYRLPIRYKVHLGGDIEIRTLPNATKIELSPQLIFTQQRQAQQTIIGTYLRSKHFTLGALSRIGDSFIVLIGYKGEDFNLGYSFDIGFKNIMSYSGGAHEVSIGYNLKHKKKHKTQKHRLISCPSF